jgi:tetrahydromethanopterin S-methyltransferase subunit D
MIRLIFASVFIPFAILVGEMIHLYGKRIVAHAFGDGSPIGVAVGGLLKIGYYLVAAGLLMWNLGVEEGGLHQSDYFTQVSLRLGVSMFVLGFLHGFNVLAVSLFHRKNAV